MSDVETARQAPSPSGISSALARAVPRLIREGSLYFGLAAIFGIGCLVSETFLTPNNQRDVLRQVSQNGILAVGMTLVIITAGIDLSVGRMLGLGSTLAAMLLVDKRWTMAAWFGLPVAALAAGILTVAFLRALFCGEPSGRRALFGTVGAFALGAALLMVWTVPQVKSGLSVWAVLVVVPLVGLMMGGLSGAIVAKCRLQPFIVTLAMMVSAYGTARLIAAASGAGYIHSLYDAEGNVPPGIDQLRVVGGVPVPGLFFLACMALGGFILTRLRFGRYIYAIGGNEETARLSGINVDRVKIAVYAISGMLSCLAGVLACAQYRQGKPEMGELGELDAIAAVVIGGSSLMGGRGRMIGTLVGVLIFGYLTNILSLCGQSTDVQRFVTGIVIVVAVLLQEGFIQRLPSRWRVRVMLALFFVLGGLLYILRADVGLIYWYVLGVTAVLILLARLLKEWNWFDSLLVVLLCVLGVWSLPRAAVLPAVVFLVLLSAQAVRHWRLRRN